MYWVSEQQEELERKFQEGFERMFYHKSRNEGFEISKKRAEQNPDNLKFAYIKIGKTRKICWVDNVTMKAYKSDGYAKTNIEIKDFTFERWCTGFDL